MPVAAADFYHCFIFWKNNIRLAGKVFNMESQPETISMENEKELESFVETICLNLYTEEQYKTGKDFITYLVRKLMRDFREKSAKDLYNTVSYYLCRYYKFFCLYKGFMGNNSLHSGICFTYSVAREGMDETVKILWNKGILACGCAIIDGCVNDSNYHFGTLPQHVESNLVFLNSANYDTELEKVRKEWQAGKKRLVVTSYQTAGAGMNVHHPVCPQYMPVGRLPHYLASKPVTENQKDIDAIALMDVTCYRDFTSHEPRCPMGIENYMK